MSLRALRSIASAWPSLQAKAVQVANEGADEHVVGLRTISFRFLSAQLRTMSYPTSTRRIDSGLNVASRVTWLRL